MNYWLIKSDPETYGWSDLKRDGSTCWDGVRNFRARSYLKAMKKGDLALFYHSNIGKEILGVVKITREHYPDPRDKAWAAVDVEKKSEFKKTVSLEVIRSKKSLAQMVLVRNSRLSVQPVKKTEWDAVIKMSGG